MRDRCVDIWTYLHYNKNSFHNPFYLDPSAEDSPTCTTFLPPLSELLRNVTLWTDYYYRWSALPTMIHPPSQLIGSLVNEAGMCVPCLYS